MYIYEEEISIRFKKENAEADLKAWIEEISKEVSPPSTNTFQTSIYADYRKNVYKKALESGLTTVDEIRIVEGMAPINGIGLTQYWKSKFASLMDDLGWIKATFLPGA